MKVHVLFIIMSFTITVNAQDVIVYKTSNPNIGFGVTSNCSTNQYMDFCVNGPLVSQEGKPIGGYIDNNHVIQNWTNPKEREGNFAINNSIFGLGQDGNFYMCSY